MCPKSYKNVFDIVVFPIGTKMLTKAEQVLGDHFLIHLFQQRMVQGNNLCKLDKYLQAVILRILLQNMFFF